MRFALPVLLGVVVACQPTPQPRAFPEPLSTPDRRHGIPRTLTASSRELLDESQTRRCQMLFDPAIGGAYAVWFVQSAPREDATVYVRLHAASEVQTFSTPLAKNVAARLSELCLEAIERAPPPPGRGYDGVWYRAAHPRPPSGYAMASLWSPRADTAEGALVRVADALSVYATVPERLRWQALSRLEEAANLLAERLAAADDE